jgi:predicted nucleic acid-binding protein
VICISDTNILSSFLSVGRLELLLTALGTDHVLIPPLVLAELELGVIRGHLTNDILQTALVSSVRTIAITTMDEQRIEHMPTAFGAGEQQAVALAMRLSMPLLSNDRRVVTYCRSQDVLCLDLPTVLRLLWRTATASQDEVQALMQGMMHQEGIVFRHAERIFADDES